MLTKTDKRFIATLFTITIISATVNSLLALNGQKNLTTIIEAAQCVDYGAKLTEMGE